MEDPSWIQRMISSPTRYGHKVSNRILDILSRVLNKRYPKAEDITENELLDWKMWPSFFEMIGNHSKVYMCIPYLVCVLITSYFTTRYAYVC